jgi:hypothetical protein
MDPFHSRKQKGFLNASNDIAFVCLADVSTSLFGLERRDKIALRLEQRREPVIGALTNSLKNLACCRLHS